MYCRYLTSKYYSIIFIYHSLLVSRKEKSSHTYLITGPISISSRLSGLQHHVQIRLPTSAPLLTSAYSSTYLITIPISISSRISRLPHRVQICLPTSALLLTSAYSLTPLLPYLVDLCHATPFATYDNGSSMMLMDAFPRYEADSGP